MASTERTSTSYVVYWRKDSWNDLQPDALHCRVPTLEIAETVVGTWEDPSITWKIVCVVESTVKQGRVGQ